MFQTPLSSYFLCFSFPLFYHYILHHIPVFFFSSVSPFSIPAFETGPKNLDGTLVCPILFAAAALKWLLNPSSQSPRRRLAFPSASSPRQLHLPAASPCCPRHSCPKGAAFPPLPYPPAGVAGRRPRSSARAGMTRRPP